jgi:hypothetical protein
VTESEKFDPPAILENKLTATRVALGQKTALCNSLKTEVEIQDRIAGDMRSDLMAMEKLLKRAMQIIGAKNETWQEDARSVLGEKK